MSSSKQEPLRTLPVEGEMGWCLSGTVFFQSKNAICLAAGLWERYTNGHFEEPVAQMPWNITVTETIWSPTNKQATGKQVLLSPESCWGKSLTVPAGALCLAVFRFIASGMTWPVYQWKKSGGRSCCMAEPIIHKHVVPVCNWIAGLA